MKVLVKIIAEGHYFLRSQFLNAGELEILVWEARVVIALGALAIRCSYYGIIITMCYRTKPQS